MKKEKKEVEVEWLGKADAAKFLGVKVGWIEKRMRNREIPYTKMERLVRFKKSDLMSYIESRTVEAA